MKYLFYAIVYDVAGNATPVGSLASPAKIITTNIQKVTEISINPNGAQTNNIGDTFKITATVSPSDANNKGITWSSSNSGIATIDSSGNVRCVSAGKTTITATAADGSGVKAQLSLTVRNPINSLTLDKDQTTILKDGYTSTVTATTDPSNYDANNISWTISDTSIATVSVSGKTATIKSTSKVGQTTLTVSAGEITKTVSVSVVNFTTQTYSYTGTVQQVDLPAGTYKLEVWGAQGGHAANTGQTIKYDYSGYGGYSTGNINLQTPTTIYIVVGGMGGINYTSTSSGLIGGFNGGGDVTETCASLGRNYYHGGGGGGATCIGLKLGLLTSYKTDYLSNLILVAGGGGAPGDFDYNTMAGSGGGFKGSSYSGSYSSTGGSQDSGGTGNGKGSFGKGGIGYGNWGGGGGGGFYGGGGGISNGHGSGGSGYINISKLTNAFMYGYNVPTSSATSTKTYSTTNVSSTPTSNYAKSGDGAARITPIN